MMACYIVQYFHHPRQLSEIVRRLVHPRLEVLVHADSNTTEDMHAFEEAQSLHPRIRISHSQNLHELRAYNKVARLARSEVLIFAQDDDIPPPTPAWVDRLLLVFETLAAPPAALAAVGLFRGKTTMWHHRVEEEEEGWRNDVGTGLHACNATRYGHGPVAPITFAADLTLSPIAVRTDAFLALGGFNESYSGPGKPAMGLEQ